MRVNKSLTLLFDDEDRFESHHLVFHVSSRDFDVFSAASKRQKSLSAVRRGVSKTASSTTGVAAVVSIFATQMDACSSLDRSAVAPRFMDVAHQPRSNVAR